MDVAALPSCVLCRSALPTSLTADRPEKGIHGDDWEFSVVCFFNLADDLEWDPPQVHMLTADLAEESSFLYCERELTLRCKGGAAGGDVKNCIHRLADPLGKRQPPRPLFFAHRDCWKVARGRLGGLAASRLYRFAQATQPIFQEPPRDRRSPRASRLAALLSQVRLETQPDAIFSRCHRLLPPEILLEVARHLVGRRRHHLAVSLAVTLQTSSALLGLVPSAPTQGVRSVDLLPQGIMLIPRDGRMCASTIEVFGRKYLSRLEFVADGDRVPDALDDHTLLSVPVRPDHISGVRFVLGMHGLRAVSFVQRGGLTTAWLGDPDTGGRYGHAAASDPRRLQLLQDDLKAVRVDYQSLMSGHAWPDLCPPSKALWDVDPDSSGLRLATRRIADTTSRPTQLMHYPGWRRCCYLPLVSDAGDSTGLTLHCHLFGIAAITVHYQRGESLTVGRKTGGIPLYFHLRPGERVDFVAVCASEGMYIQGPCLVLGTNRGRSAFFGPCYQRYDNYSKWAVVASEPVAGLIVDSSATNEYPRLQNVGAATAPPTSRPASYPRSPPAFPDFSGRLRDCLPFTKPSSFFTSARIFSPHGLRRLRVRRVGRSCDGLCLHHADGTIETLGRWDGSVGDGEYHGQEAPLGVYAHDGAATAADVVVTDMLDGADAPRVIRWIAFRHVPPPCPAAPKGVGVVVDIKIGLGEDDLPVGAAANAHWVCTRHASDLKTEFLAWWCEGTYDHVEPWDGEMAVHRMPPRSSPPVMLSDF